MVSIPRRSKPAESANAESQNEKRSVSSASTVVPSDPTVRIHPSPDGNGVLIKVEPPKVPSNPVAAHVPCDIVLVIDVSYSMSNPAPAMSLSANGSAAQENTGYTVLDITKHAALTILETLDDRDRLGIVTFSNAAKVIQKLIPMTKTNKKQTDKHIRAMKPEYATNIWGGIQEGLNLMMDKTNTGRVPAIMVLTDGQPNTGEPTRGYIPAIRSLGPLPAVIHTFGFGYDLQSGLLKSIAELGGGNYSFIPDSGMVGTVFVNTVAHLQSTYANKCSLEVTFPDDVCLATTNGETVNAQERKKLTDSSLKAISSDDGVGRRLTIDLGNLQYGQSRDIFLRYTGVSRPAIGNVIVTEKLGIGAQLKYSLMNSPEYIVSASIDQFETTDLSYSEIAYHQSRSMFCEYISDLFPLKADEEHETNSCPAIDVRKAGFEDLLARIPARDRKDQKNKSLMEDISGQVQLAILNEEYFEKWGRHFLLSLWNAHDKQLRNTFKDPGVQMYNTQSPLFLSCQAELMDAFDKRVPPVEPSAIATADPKYQSGGITISMSSYNRSDYPCFAASSLVCTSSGKQVPVSTLRKGTSVQTPAGNRRVVAVLKTRVSKIAMCKVGELVITPWHPIMGDSGHWAFPADVAEKTVRYSGAIYSVLLQADGDVDAHALKIGGVWGVTLGHGITSGDDVRAHGFLGDYRKVSKALLLLGLGKDGVVVGSGIRREKTKGHMCGFKRARKHVPTK